MTSTEAQTMTGIERAMALDLLDADPITRLTEDEDGIFIPEVDDEGILDEDFAWGLSVHNNG
jgi:hypothetical protein